MCFRSEEEKKRSWSHANIIVQQSQSCIQQKGSADSVVFLTLAQLSRLLNLGNTLRDTWMLTPFPTGAVEAKLHWPSLPVLTYLYVSITITVARGVWGCLPQENFLNLMLWDGFWGYFGAQTLWFSPGMVTGFWFSSLVCAHGDKCPSAVSNPLGTMWRSDPGKNAPPPPTHRGLPTNPIWSNPISANKMWKGQLTLVHTCNNKYE